MATRTAILGWGSLLWEEGEEFDHWHKPWKEGGPSLNLEFSRASKKRLGALTLVIDAANGSPVQVAWCLSTRRNPDDAIADLRCREGTTLANIGRYFLATNAYQSTDKESSDAIAAWGKRNNIDVIVWTDLKSNFEEIVKQPYSVAAALTYIKTLPPEGKAMAAEYVWRAPEFVQTPLRAALQSEPWFSPPDAIQS